VIALFNPASKARPDKIHQAFALLRACRAATIPVAFARAIGRPDERIVLSTIGEADPSIADMSTLVLIGSSETRFIERPGNTPWLLTPRTYGQRNVNVADQPTLGSPAGRSDPVSEPDSARRSPFASVNAGASSGTDLVRRANDERTTADTGRRRDSQVPVCHAPGAHR
jgi:hypothetical protein